MSDAGRRGAGLLALVALIAGCSDGGRTAPQVASTTAATATADPTAAPSPGRTDASAPTPGGLLLPNMSSLPAEDVHLEVLPDGTRNLRFAAILANTGAGPLLATPDGSRPCPQGQRFATQLIHLDADGDGTFDPALDQQTTTHPAGCMIFHPMHDHWHFDASARYVLTDASTGAPVAVSDKVSFCLRDTRPLPGTATPVAYEGCERDTIQGISPGWGDVYESDLDGQALALPTALPDGPYCLRLGADPYDRWREVDNTDNRSVVSVTITATTAQVAGTSAC